MIASSEEETVAGIIDRGLFTTNRQITTLLFVVGSLNTMASSSPKKTTALRGRVYVCEGTFLAGRHIQRHEYGIEELETARYDQVPQFLPRTKWPAEADQEHELRPRVYDLPEGQGWLDRWYEEEDEQVTQDRLALRERVAQDYPNLRPMPMYVNGSRWPGAGGSHVYTPTENEDGVAWLDHVAVVHGILEHTIPAGRRLRDFEMSHLIAIITYGISHTVTWLPQPWTIAGPATAENEELPPRSQAPFRESFNTAFGMEMKDGHYHGPYEDGDDGDNNNVNDENGEYDGVRNQNQQRCDNPDLLDDLEDSNSNISTNTNPSDREYREPVSLPVRFKQRITGRRYIIVPISQQGRWIMTIFDRREAQLFIFDPCMTARNERIEAAIHLWTRFWNSLNMVGHFTYFAPEVWVPPSGEDKTGMLAIHWLIMTLRNQVGPAMRRDNAEIETRDILIQSFRSDRFEIRDSSLKLPNWAPRFIASAASAETEAKRVIQIMICNELGHLYHPVMRQPAYPGRNQLGLTAAQRLHPILMTQRQRDLMKRTVDHRPPHDLIDEIAERNRRRPSFYTRYGGPQFAVARQLNFREYLENEEDLDHPEEEHLHPIRTGPRGIYYVTYRRAPVTSQRYSMAWERGPRFTADKPLRQDISMMTLEARGLKPDPIGADDLFFHPRTLRISGRPRGGHRDWALREPDPHEFGPPVARFAGIPRTLRQMLVVNVRGAGIVSRNDELGHRDYYRIYLDVGFNRNLGRSTHEFPLDRCVCRPDSPIMGSSDFSASPPPPPTPADSLGYGSEDDTLLDSSPRTPSPVVDDEPGIIGSPPLGPYSPVDFNPPPQQQRTQDAGRYYGASLDRVRVPQSPEQLPRRSPYGRLDRVQEPPQLPQQLPRPAGTWEGGWGNVPNHLQTQQLPHPSPYGNLGRVQEPQQPQQRPPYAGRPFGSSWDNVEEPQLPRQLPRPSPNENLDRVQEPQSTREPLRSAETWEGGWDNVPSPQQPQTPPPQRQYSLAISDDGLGGNDSSSDRYGGEDESNEQSTTRNKRSRTPDNDDSHIFDRRPRKRPSPDRDTTNEQEEQEEQEEEVTEFTQDPVIQDPVIQDPVRRSLFGNQSARRSIGSGTATARRTTRSMRKLGKRDN